MIRFRMLLLEPLRDDIQLTLGLGKCYSGFQASNGAEMTLVTSIVVVFFSYRAVELPFGRHQRYGQWTKVRAHHADDVVRPAVQRNCFADDVRVTAKTALPQAIAQDDNEVFAILLFFRVEDTAEERRAFHDFEEAVANLNGGNSFGFRIA